jgi:hypothetical protein
VPTIRLLSSNLHRVVIDEFEHDGAPVERRNETMSNDVPPNASPGSRKSNIDHVIANSRLISDRLHGAPYR